MFGLPQKTLTVLPAVIGPAGPPSTAGSIAMVIFGIIFAIAGLAPDTQLRAAFSFGKGPGTPIGSAGRLILLLMALVLLVAGIGRLLR
jgi:hypothetical protein